MKNRFLLLLSLATACLMLSCSNSVVSNNNEDSNDENTSYLITNDPESSSSSITLDDDNEENGDTRSSSSVKDSKRSSSSTTLSSSSSTTVDDDNEEKGDKKSSSSIGDIKSSSSSTTSSDDNKENDDEGSSSSITLDDDNEENVVIEAIPSNCFNSFRLPNLQSESCKEQFYSKVVVKNFPESGFFQRTFTIAFPNNKELNCEIGGKPVTSESPLLSSISVDSSMAIRCADFSGKTSNNEIIRTYILEKNPDVAAVFLTTDSNSLFDPDTGIYMEGPNADVARPHYGANYWLDKEIPVFVELVENGRNTPAFAKSAGLKIFGNWSREKAKKSVAITFRKSWGDKRLNYSLFPEFPELNEFKSFILRNFGNNFGRDYIRDRLASSLSEGLDVDYQRGRFTIVYYNGKYFGLHDMRERSNEHYFETHYSMDDKKIDLLDAYNIVSEGSADDYIALMQWLETHPLDNEENYSYLTSQIDIDNYINYMAVEMFVDNRDWPGNNLKKWRNTSPKTKWKFFLYDLDWGFGGGYSKTTNSMFEYLTSEKGECQQNNPKYTLLFRSLLKSDEFKALFINRMLALLKTNFETQNILSKINKMTNEIKTEIPRDQNRWSLNTNDMDKQLEIIKRFATNRPKTIYSELLDFFDLENEIQ